MYRALGITGSRDVLVAGIYNCVGPIANAIFIFFILDRFGRKKPLIFGTIGISLALICEAAINSQNPTGTRKGLSVGGVFFLFLVSVIFSLSFGPISWVYMSEIMPMQIRGRGNAFATGIGNWLVATFFAQVSPIALGAISWKYYFVSLGLEIENPVGSPLIDPRCLSPSTSSSPYQQSFSSSPKRTRSLWKKSTSCSASVHWGLCPRTLMIRTWRMLFAVKALPARRILRSVSRKRWCGRPMPS